MVILPKLARLNRTYPEIILEITSSNDPVDLVAGEYDAGVQLGEFIQRDMIAVRVTKEMRGSPPVVRHEFEKLDATRAKRATKRVLIEIPPGSHKCSEPLHFQLRRSFR
jgi:DNA-binding transcriptional LysR family regulator